MDTRNIRNVALQGRWPVARRLLRPAKRIERGLDAVVATKQVSQQAGGRDAGHRREEQQVDHPARTATG